MKNYELMKFFNEIDFSPMFFLTEGGTYVDFNEFRAYMETDIMDTLENTDHIITTTYLNIMFAYTYFFKDFYIDAPEDIKEIFLRNEARILALNKYEQNYMVVLEFCKNRNLSEKWINLITDLYNMEDNLEKALYSGILKNMFVNEFIQFTLKWLPDTIKNSPNEIKQLNMYLDGTIEVTTKIKEN